MGYLNDTETIDIEQLGAAQFAKPIQSMILEVTPPFSFSIGARWGGGKSSTLRALWASLTHGYATDTSIEGKLPASLELDAEQKKKKRGLYVKTVWFNPWQHQHEQNPLVPLLHEIREQMRHQTLHQGLAGCATVFEAGIHTMGALIDDAQNISYGRNLVSSGKTFMTQVQSVAQRKEKQNFSGRLESQYFRSAFEDAVIKVVSPKLATKSNNQTGVRLVVFIDDLDRCSDQTVFTLLESIKLYLSSKYCIFVFGMDRGHVENAVAKAAMFTPVEAAQYVEKLFQTRLTLPSPSHDQIKKFVQEMLKKTEEFKSLEDEKLSRLAELLSVLSPNNPRFIKNLINGLILYKKLFLEKENNDKQSELKDHIHPLLLVHYLRTVFPDAYELLAQRQTGALQALLHVCVGDDPSQDDRKRYYAKILENPLISPENKPPAFDAAVKPSMDTEEFRHVRASAWRAKAIQRFRDEFAKAFNPNTQGADSVESSATETVADGTPRESTTSVEPEYAKIERYLV
ncbi:KAP P-loop domain protein [Magnetococcus marinus MC-1]|uniref:KAP P-loop domain protein n=1 Tax=Magnetococcus marinus (strain ATCC BAA-1437 / JCM 17883 / MC-1) TaxID=156889 RepID=A0L5F3_MAGMM|nr:KAP P-loop domain-containing protein [Magnetococcus marinus]ABK43196.1 KAP P-loop domain protein [Magnetococcus marinus MC-1]